MCTCTGLETRGPNGLKSVVSYFRVQSVYFLSDFDAVFFFRFLIEISFGSMRTDLTQLLPFPRYKGSKGVNAQNRNFFILSRILTNFFYNIFVLMSTKRICQLILAIGSHFGIKGSKGPKTELLQDMQIFKFLSDFDGIFFIGYLFQSFQYISLCQRKLLCPANYCIKHFSVSSSLMSPHSLEITLVQISVVDMLRSYYAALGVALYFF